MGEAFREKKKEFKPGPLMRYIPKIQPSGEGALVLGVDHLGGD